MMNTFCKWLKVCVAAKEFLYVVTGKESILIWIIAEQISLPYDKILIFSLTFMPANGLKARHITSNLTQVVFFCCFSANFDSL